MAGFGQRCREACYMPLAEMQELHIKTRLDSFNLCKGRRVDVADFLR
jgi:hypothetical protein